MSRAKAPNIVIVTFHDLGRHIGPYGVKTVRTPAFDELARRGAVFADAFATAPQCSPSRTSLATGLYPQRHGVLGLAHEPFGWDMAPGVRHIADLLGQHGYETHQFGFQHVTMQPERMGFTKLHGRQPGAALRDTVAQFVAEADWSARAPSRYLEINVEEPHRPFSQGGIEPDETRGLTVPEWLTDTPHNRADMAMLQGAIAHADATLGAVLRAIDDAGIADGTIVVACADHGIALERAKCTLYDPGIEVALLIAHPGHVTPGEITGHVSIVDVLPTLFELAGVGAPADIHGVSQAGALLTASADTVRQADTAADFLFAQKTFHTYFDPMRCVRGGGYKLIRNFDATPAVEIPLDIATDPHAPCQQVGTHPAVELYDLGVDPNEFQNLAESPDHVEILAELDRELLAWMQRVDDPILRGLVPTPPTMTKRLRDFVSTRTVTS